MLASHEHQFIEMVAGTGVNPQAVLAGVKYCWICGAVQGHSGAWVQPEAKKE